MYRGRSWLAGEHIARLARSLAELDFPAHDLARILRRIERTIAASGIGDGTVYVQITRGVAPRSHAFPDPPVPSTEVIVVRPYDDSKAAELRASGARLISHPDLRWKRCDIKSTNLLANVLAIEAAHRAGRDEAVLFDSHGLVTEASHSSVLWVRDGSLQGTPDGHEILPGTTRQLILRIAKSLEISWGASRVTLAGLAGANEVILVGTTSEVVPVVQLDDELIGDGRPGPIARRLGQAYRQEVERWLASPPPAT
jgi:D-alanine transaminase